MRISTINYGEDESLEKLDVIIGVYPHFFSKQKAITILLLIDVYPFRSHLGYY